MMTSRQMRFSAGAALFCATALLSGTTQAALGTIAANTSADYAKTRYPIVLVPGMGGFSRLGSAGFGVDYFYQVMPDLARNGATTFVTQVSPFDSTEIRGEQLLIQVEEVRAITGQDKVNLIGHSHGGPTARYVAAIKPDYVASVTGVAGAFYGSKVADDLLALPALERMASTFGQYILNPVINWLQQNNSLTYNLGASLKSLSEAGARVFNERYPTAALPDSCATPGAPIDGGIRYYSWSGRAHATNLLDPDSIVVQLAPLSYKNADNDGMITTCNSHLGKVIRDDYRLNHFDEVNQVLGLRDIMAPDPVALYRQHANRLKLAGL